MSVDPVPVGDSDRWMIHDVVIGLLAGAGAGGIAGLYLVARVVENSELILVGAVTGAILGVFLLRRSHRRNPDRFLTPAVIVSWIVLVLSAAFIALLASAIANFQ